jgi:hypothetical protein
MMTSCVAEMPVYLTKSMRDPGFGESVGKAIAMAIGILTRHCINNRIMIERMTVCVPSTLIDAVPNRRYYDDDIASLAEIDPFGESIEARMISRYEASGDKLLPDRRAEPVEFIVRIRMFTVK